ncbi:methyltransferase domain-containing protein [Afifella sp. IM 167]|uniref:methyltransferase domain-containing protein n=1 Tax=Afifella sp. IM 167 TaxID=2033586 RepID=UPI001CCCC3A3|nr:methyltransferase domain-containing protein [Afifella sp. IM 167]MBZ8134239.1 hypothetical protein [Afifella sp. IM 167]
MKQVLSPLYALLESPAGYNLIQQVNRPTTDRIRALFHENVRLADGGRVLDLGCGTGNYRPLFSADYVGIDINPDYIRMCSEKLEGTFLVMDGANLTFEDDSFDNVVSIATTHHLTDEQLAAMLKEAVRVTKPGGFVNVIDAVLPDSAAQLFKTIWFRMDRGEYPRKLAHLTGIAAGAGEITHSDLRRGPMHDVVYLRLSA